MSSTFGTFAYSSPIDFRLGIEPPNSAKITPEDAPAIFELYAFSKQTIRAFVDNCGIGPQTSDRWGLLAGTPGTLLAGNLNRLYVIASENIIFGAAISLFNNAGVLNARNANAADNTKICDGFCCFPGGIAAGLPGEVILNNGVAPISGLTIGHRYWLSTVNGEIAGAPAVAAGNVEQYIGVAITTTSLSFNVGNWLQH